MDVIVVPPKPIPKQLTANVSSRNMKDRKARFLNSNNKRRFLSEEEELRRALDEAFIETPESRLSKENLAIQLLQAHKALDDKIKEFEEVRITNLEAIEKLIFEAYAIFNGEIDIDSVRTKIARNLGYCSWEECKQVSDRINCINNLNWLFDSEKSQRRYVNQLLTSRKLKRL